MEFFAPDAPLGVSNDDLTISGNKATFNGSEFPVECLRDAKPTSSGAQVRIQVKPGTTYQQVIQAMDGLRAAGIRTFVFGEDKAD